MEIFTIGFTIHDVIKGNKLRQETLDAIADWEARQAASGLDAVAGDQLVKSPSEYSGSTTLKSVGDSSIGKQSFDSKSDILTMTALENALRTNAMPLLEFAALKDFSGRHSPEAQFANNHTLTVYQQARMSASLLTWRSGDATGFRKARQPLSTIATSSSRPPASTLTSFPSSSPNFQSISLPER